LAGVRRDDGGNIGRVSVSPPRRGFDDRQGDESLPGVWRMNGIHRALAGLNGSYQHNFSFN